MTVEEKKLWIGKKQMGLSVAAQCKLLGVARSSYYYRQVPINESELWLMRRVDELYTTWPFYGSRKIMQELKREGHGINRKHVQRIMRRLGLAEQPAGTKHFKAASRTRQIPLFAEWAAHTEPSRSVEYRYHLHSTPTGVHVSGSY